MVIAFISIIRMVSHVKVGDSRLRLSPQRVPAISTRDCLFTHRDAGAAEAMPAAQCARITTPLDASQRSFSGVARCGK